MALPNAAAATVVGVGKQKILMKVANRGSFLHGGAPKWAKFGKKHGPIIGALKVSVLSELLQFKTTAATQR